MAQSLLSLAVGCHTERATAPVADLRQFLSKAPVFVEHWPMQSPPIPARRDSITDQMFGVRVEDPYRWLEDAKNRDVERFVQAQNALTERTLSRISDRARIRERLTQLFRIGTLSLPTLRRTKSGELRLFYSRRDAGNEQPMLYVRDGLRGIDRVLVDPTAFGGHATSALDWYEPSEDGSLLAYGVSQSGSEDSVLGIRDVASGRDLPDRIDRTRFASIAWAPDGKLFFYTRHPKPGSVPEEESRYHRKLYSHVLGTDPERDPLVFGADLGATDFPTCVLSPNGRWLVVTVSRGWSESALYLADLRQKEPSFERITSPKPRKYAALARNDKLFVMSDDGAPNQQIFEVDPERPEPANWRLLIPEHPTWVIKNFEVVRDEVLLAYLDAGISRLERFDKSGKHRARAELKALGTSDGFSGLPEGTEAFFAYDSFATPPEVHRLDLQTGKAELWEAVKADIQSDEYLVSALSARSRDGTQIPYHVVRRRDVDLKRGDNPTLLYGYGGFNDTMEPRFSRSLQVFLEHGGVYVQAILRGGGEFGEAWHRAGQLDKKQNTFDDFIAVAEHLQTQRVTDRSHLAVYGRSNGGLLVAAVITQRPDLFRAGVAGVPLTDMLRYPKFLIGRLWEPEYGSPDDAKAFQSLFAYSPYHNVRDGTRYPSLLVTTAESDTRVDPLHARKFVAALQNASTSDRPILLRTESVAGHGAGTPVSKQVLELSDVYAFVFAELGLSSSAVRNSD